MWRIVTAGAAIAALAGFYVASYGDATGTYYSFDDYWVMARAASVTLHSPLDLWRFFLPDHNGFVMYRPLSTTVYFYLLRALFGYDPAGYHAAHLVLNLMNACLVGALGSIALRDRWLGFATALLYAMAPGGALAAYWVALCTVTGTAFFYLLASYAWLRGWRLAVVPVFVLALGCAEHAITLPLTLTLALLILEGRWPARADLRALVPLYGIMVGYVAAKLYYFRVSPLAKLLLELGYGMTPHPLRWLENLGRYAGYASVMLYPLVCPGAATSRFVAIATGGGLVLAAVLVGVVKRPGRPASRTIRAAAFGLLAFPVMIGPVLLLGDHLYGHYVAIAACGLSLATIGALRSLPRIGHRAPAACLAGALAIHLAYSAHAVQGEVGLTFFRGFGRSAVQWLYTVQLLDGEHPELRQLVTKRDFTTSLIFETGAYQLLLPGVRLSVQPVDEPSTFASQPETMVIENPYATPPGLRVPGARPRWDWLRAASPTPGG